MEEKLIVNNQLLTNTIEITHSIGLNLKSNSTVARKPTGNVFPFFYIRDYPIFVIGPHCN